MAERFYKTVTVHTSAAQDGTLTVHKADAVLENAYWRIYTEGNSEVHVIPEEKVSRVGYKD